MPGCLWGQMLLIVYLALENLFPFSDSCSAAEGWRSILEVLIVAAADFAAAVVNQALDALQPVIAALYGDVGVGHQHFVGIVTAVAAAMRSPYHVELSISAVHVMQGIARRLAQSDPKVSLVPFSVIYNLLLPVCPSV